MIGDLLAWLWIAALPVAAYPCAVVLVADGLALRSATALGLSAGAIWAIMLIAGLIGVPLTFAAVAIPYAILALVGLVIAWRRGWRPSLKLALPADPVARFALIGAALLCAAILFNGVYYPFYRDDAVAIYAPQAAEIARTDALVPLRGADTLYRAYPMLAQFNMAHSFQVAGWLNESLAKLIPTLLALGCFPAAYALGTQIGGRRSGWLSVIALALLPAMARWGSAGYVDLPMAFFYTLAAVFALKSTQQDSPRTNAVLAGVMIALATQTKNAGLIGVPLLGAWWLYGVITRKVKLTEAAISLLVCGLISAPWYLRNVIEAGFIWPPTAWTDQARHTLDNLLIFVTLPDNFGLTGWLIASALPLSAVHWRRDGVRLIWLWAAPFFAAWWVLASYDPRFLLLFTPLLCTLVGVVFATLIERVRSRVVFVIAGVVTAALIALNVFWSVDYKGDLLRSPFMSYDEKLILVGRDSTDLDAPISP